MVTSAVTCRDDFRSHAFADVFVREGTVRLRRGFDDVQGGIQSGNDMISSSGVRNDIRNASRV